MNKEGIEKLEAEAGSLMTLLIRAYAQFLFLRPMLVHNELIARIGTEGKMAGFEQLRNLLYWNFIQELVQLCEDNDKRTTSVSKLMEKIKDPSVKKILEDKFSCQGLPQIEGEDEETRNRHQKEYEEEWREKFRKDFDRLQNNTEKLLDSNALSGFKKIRDSLIAHNELWKTANGYEFFDIATLKLKFGQERELFELLKEVVIDLNSVVRNAGFSWESFLEPETRDVCKFWEIESIEPDGVD